MCRLVRALGLVERSLSTPNLRMPSLRRARLVLRPLCIFRPSRHTNTSVRNFIDVECPRAQGRRMAGRVGGQVCNSCVGQRGLSVAGRSWEEG